MCLKINHTISLLCVIFRAIVVNLFFHNDVKDVNSYVTGYIRGSRLYKKEKNICKMFHIRVHINIDF